MLYTRALSVFSITVLQAFIGWSAWVRKGKRLKRSAVAAMEGRDDRSARTLLVLWRETAHLRARAQQLRAKRRRSFRKALVQGWAVWAGVSALVRKSISRLLRWRAFWSVPVKIQGEALRAWQHLTHVSKQRQEVLAVLLSTECERTAAVSGLRRVAGLLRLATASAAEAVAAGEEEAEREVWARKVALEQACEQRRRAAQARSLALCRWYADRNAARRVVRCVECWFGELVRTRRMHSVRRRYFRRILCVALSAWYTKSVATRRRQRQVHARQLGRVRRRSVAHLRAWSALAASRCGWRALLRHRLLVLDNSSLAGSFGMWWEFVWGGRGSGGGSLGGRGRRMCEPLVERAEILRGRRCGVVVRCVWEEWRLMVWQRGSAEMLRRRRRRGSGQTVVRKWRRAVEEGLGRRRMECWRLAWRRRGVLRRCLEAWWRCVQRSRSLQRRCARIVICLSCSRSPLSLPPLPPPSPYLSSSLPISLSRSFNHSTHSLTLRLLAARLRIRRGTSHACFEAWYHAGVTGREEARRSMEEQICERKNISWQIQADEVLR